MTRHEIDALLRLAFLMPMCLWTADQSVRKSSYRTLVAPEKTADIIAEAPIPLPPTVAAEASHLVQPGVIPRLGDEPARRDDWLPSGLMPLAVAPSAVAGKVNSNKRGA
jgi:hypothetical protein